jgi:hypothetical protein
MSTIGRQASAAGGAAGSAEGARAAIRVLLIGDVRLYRELLAAALEAEEGIELAGSALGDVASMAVGMRSRASGRGSGASARRTASAIRSSSMTSSPTAG